MARVRLFFLAATLVSATAFAQGVQTGSLSGVAEDQSGGVLPGVTVSATSPAVQGARTTVTDANGNYVLRALPPGQYDVAFSVSGFKPVTLTLAVGVGLQSTANATLYPVGVAETVSVTAVNDTTPVASPTLGQNLTLAEVNALPLGRTLAAIAAFSPGLTSNTPNTGQVTIAGAFAYDNKYLVDGADIDDNLFGSADSLFVEDAVAQTQVLTSGIPAEYGGFSGGIINAVTKSGGNAFSGSFRTNLTNTNWTTRTPFEKARGTTRPDQLSTVYEGTFGGPLQRDRLWFFTSGRSTKSDATAPLPRTAIPFTTVNKERRGEVKITATLGDGNVVTGSYFKRLNDQTRVPFGFSIDPNVAESPSVPNDRLGFTFNRALSDRLAAEVRYSRKRFAIRNSGGSDTSVFASPFITITLAQSHYNAPYFDATDPEDRNNHQFSANLAYLATMGRSTHDVKVGVDKFQTSRTGGNSQSASNYVFYVDYLTDAAGQPAFDANNRLTPVFVPGVSEIEQWSPTRGAIVRTNTLAFFAQDSWKVNGRLTLDLGARFEKVDGEATGNITTVDTSAFVPRLAASYAVDRSAQTIVKATYAQYAGKYSESQFAENTPVGNPQALFGVYTGPAGQGTAFAPGFNPDNYLTYDGTFPTANIFFDTGLHSPITTEFTASVARQVGRGFAQVSYITRSMSSFVEDFITRSEGTTTVVQDGVEFGTFDNVLYRNSDVPVRDYAALQFQGRYRVRSNWTVDGHLTTQIKNDGNFEGEAANQPGVSSLIGDRPEIYDPARHFPTGRLDDYQQHKARLWTIYGQDLKRFGHADISFVYKYDSALSYSLRAAGVGLSSAQRAAGAAAGYAALPNSQTLFFGERGSERFSGAHTMDMGLNYRIPVVRQMAPYIEFDVLNLANASPLISHNITVAPDPASPRDALGLPTGFTKNAAFGTATSNSSYPLARTWRVAFGVRW